MEKSVNTSLAIVIPVYNEEQGIGDTLEDLSGNDFLKGSEIIVVDDGSKDATVSVIRKYPVTLLRHSVNKGYGASLKTGIRHARAKNIIIMDGDGQHTSGAIEEIARNLSDNPMVIGERTIDSFQVANRKFGKWIIRVVGEYLVEQRLPDYNSGFRGFDRRIMRSLLHLMPNGFSFSTTSTLAFLKEGYSIGTVPIKVKARVGRVSNVRPLKDGIKTLMLLMRIIMLFNPLKIFLPASIIAGLCGAIIAFFDMWIASRVSNGAVTILVMAMFLFFFGLLADQISMLNLRERDDGSV